MTQTEPDVGQYLSFVHAVLTEPVRDQSQTGRADDLTAAVQHAEVLVSAFPDLDELVAEARYYAAWARDELFELTGDPAHLDREIEHLRALPAADATDLLVDALSARQETRDGLDDIDEALRLQRALVASSDDQPARTKLGLLVAQRFRASPPDDPDQLAELSEALELLSEAEHTVPPDDPDRPKVITALGHLHVMSHLAPRMTPGAARSRDLDRGIDLLRSVAEYYAEAADRLAFALDRRYSELERRADRDEAIAVYERLCAELPDYVEDCAAELGTLYLAKLDDEPTQETFERTVACLERALRRRLPDTEYLHAYLIEAYLLRWGHVPPEELDRLRALCVEMAGTDPFWSDMLLGIDVETAVSGNDREQIRACVATVADEVLGPYQEDKNTGMLAGVLATLLATGWPDWSPFTLLAKGSVEGASALLDWLRRHRIPADHPDHPLFATGIALLTAHLPVPPDEAVAELDTALGLLPADHPAVAALQYELGRRHVSSDGPARQDRVDRGLALLTDAATRFPVDDPARARCLGTLGTGLFSAFSQGLARPDVVHRADELVSTALDETTFAPEFRAAMLMSLGLVRGLRWLVDPVHGDMRTGLALHEQALSLLPADHTLCLDIRFGVSLLLATRSQLTRNLDDAATAETHLRAIGPLLEEREPDGFVSAAGVASMLRVVRLARITHGDTVSPADSGELDEIIDSMAAESPADDYLLSYARIVRAHHRGNAGEAVRLMARLEDSVAAFPEHMPFLSTVRSLSTMVRAGEAMIAGDQQGFEERAATLAARAHAPDVPPEERARFLYLLGGTWSIGHTRSRAPHLLDKAITAFEECRALPVATVEPFALLAAEELSTLYWKRQGPGDAERALERGFEALREHARQVLLHEEVANGASKAGAMADNAHALALRCVAAGRPERAVAAVEGGRGLAMHVVTSDVGAVLRELGHEDVALEWEHSLRARTDRPAGVEFPTDLRYRVLALLAGTEEERRLLSGPAPADIARALRETGADALVYLVPAAGGEPGHALLVTSDGRVDAVPLPALTVATGAEVDRYLTAHRVATTAEPADRSHAVRRWQAELGELVRWAWPAVVGPVLTALAAETPHVVLVPCGPLGVVPWHAACDDSTGRPRFALGRAVFSYTASARQLCDVATRPGRDPAEEAVVVADPTGDLFGSTREARYLYQHHYPHGTYFGVLPDGVPHDGAGTPDDVLALLPAASVLHLACHAVTGPTPAESFVELSGRLTVNELLRHTRGRPRNEPGGLVVLAACYSDLADREHDEALTLATAFLAAGAASVVGTRWAVDDQRAAVLMCLFHRYLTVDGLPPAKALRAAQLWALDPDRELPADIAAVFGTTRPEIPVTTWAAFSHQGR